MAEEWRVDVDAEGPFAGVAEGTPERPPRPVKLQPVPEPKPAPKKPTAKATEAEVTERARKLAVEQLTSLNSLLGMLPPVAETQRFIASATQGQASLLLTAEEIGREADALVAVPEIRAWLAAGPSPLLNLLLLNVYLGAQRAVLIAQILPVKRQMERDAAARERAMRDGTIPVAAEA